MTTAVLRVKAITTPKCQPIAGHSNLVSMRQTATATRSMRSGLWPSISYSTAVLASRRNSTTSNKSSRIVSTTRDKIACWRLQSPIPLSTPIPPSKHSFQSSYKTTRTVSTTTPCSKPLDTTLPSYTPPPSPTPPSTTTHPSPLSTLPLSSVLRTYLITTLSARPLLLTLTISILQRMLASRSPFFNVDRNPFLRLLLKRTFYAQFCAGEDSEEVAGFVGRMEKVGYSGVALEYASEVLEEGEGMGEEDVRSGIERWERGIRESVEMSREGSFVAFKYSGMGPSTLRRLIANAPPSEAEAAAIRRVCDVALAKRIRVSPAAEPQNAQRAVNEWTLELARVYNRHDRHTATGETGETPALIYNTYQCYLRSTPSTLLTDLLRAEEQGFTLGVKLVRGAYLATEQRSLIHATKEDTDDAYDGLAEALLKGTFEGPLVLPEAQEEEDKTGSIEERGMKRVDVLLATHNLKTVEMALEVRGNRVAEMRKRMDMTEEATTASTTAPPLGDLSFAQLQGMADEVSCALLAAQKQVATGRATTSTPPLLEAESYCRGPAPHVYKYCNWGTLSECLAYLLRRAAENRDAAGRTRDTALAMRGEIVRRARSVVGL